MQNMLPFSSSSTEYVADETVYVFHFRWPGWQPTCLTAGLDTHGALGTPPRGGGFGSPPRRALSCFAMDSIHDPASQHLRIRESVARRGPMLSSYVESC